VLPVSASLASAATETVRRLDERLAAAPISWGVCEVPGWGAQLPPATVLAEMRALGFRATEFGPAGYLGSDAGEIRALLARYELALVGGFLPVVLHEREARRTSLASAQATAALYAACGGRVLVSAAVADAAWTQPEPLDGSGWRRLAEGLAELDEVAGTAGLVHVLHPHVDTLVQTRADVERVLELSAVALCLDTGHLVLGDADPLALAREAGERIRHVHLKDVDASVAERRRAGEFSLVEAVQAGLFRPLGAGDVPVAQTVAALEAAGYGGWYVLEQDTALVSADTTTGGTADDVRRSIDYLRAVIEAARATTTKEGSE
jgi:inosose dehydratase